MPTCSLRVLRFASKICRGLFAGPLSPAESRNCNKATMLVLFFFSFVFFFFAGQSRDTDPFNHAIVENDNCLVCSDTQPISEYNTHKFTNIYSPIKYGIVKIEVKTKVHKSYCFIVACISDQQVAGLRVNEFVALLLVIPAPIASLIPRHCFNSLQLSLQHVTKYYLTCRIFDITIRASSCYRIDFCLWLPLHECDIQSLHVILG